MPDLPCRLTPAERRQAAKLPVALPVRPQDPDDRLLALYAALRRRTGLHPADLAGTEWDRPQGGAGPIQDRRSVAIVADAGPGVKEVPDV